MRRVVVSEFVTLDEVFEAGALLLGRETYQIFAAFWPTAPPDGGFADRMNAIPKYVVSTTLEQAAWQNTTVIKGDVAGEIAKLKQEPGGDIFIHGSADLVDSLIGHDLIDEYRIMVFPVVQGEGRKLWAEGTKIALSLTGTWQTKTGVDVVTYVPA
jgi:dihydrofolate reductase